MSVLPIHRKLYLGAAGLCLPTVIVVLFGVFFLIDRVPVIIRNEQRRVQAEYREQALELKNHPETGKVVTRGKGAGWAKDRKMAPGFWGTVPTGPKMGTDPAEVGTVPAGQVLVWYLDDKGRCIGKLTEIEVETNFRLIFWICGPIVLVLLVGLTGMGVKYFVDYVKSRDDFLAATAHDLTTPLVGLRYTIGQNDVEAKNLNERLIRLVENIKDFLKLGGRRPLPKCEKIDLVACFNEAYALFREDYREIFDGRDLALTVGSVPSETGSVPRVFALADETLTVQILWNLLGNDLKYAAPYGAVRARLDVRGGRAVLELEDEGKGMTPHERRRAFDRYYRAKTVLESGKGGFGIGLCTAREFAEAMGGSLTVAANKPRGCVFTLSLPCAIG